MYINSMLQYSKKIFLMKNIFMYLLYMKYIQIACFNMFLPNFVSSTLDF